MLFMTFNQLLNDIRTCQLCKASLPNECRPIIQASASSKILIIGQAPGIKAHDSGTPFNDASGNRLREWLNVSRETFYDSSKIAIMPMGFCYPGKGKSGDLPPLKICAPTWHQNLLKNMPNIKLTLLIGQYAQTYYLKETQFFKTYNNLTLRVQHSHEAPQGLICLPHPSPRNQIWLKKNPWFEANNLPHLQKQVLECL